jgi:hypothetical protein
MSSFNGSPRTLAEQNGDSGRQGVRAATVRFASPDSTLDDVMTFGDSGPRISLSRTVVAMRYVGELRLRSTRNAAEPRSKGATGSPIQP